MDIYPWVIPEIWNCYTFNMRRRQWPGLPSWVYSTQKITEQNIWVSSGGSGCLLTRDNAELYFVSGSDDHQLNWMRQGNFEDFRAGWDYGTDPNTWALQPTKMRIFRKHDGDDYAWVAYVPAAAEIDTKYFQTWRQAVAFALLRTAGRP